MQAIYPFSTQKIPTTLCKLLGRTHLTRSSRPNFLNRYHIAKTPRLEYRFPQRPKVCHEITHPKTSYTFYRSHSTAPRSNINQKPLLNPPIQRSVWSTYKDGYGGFLFGLVFLDVLISGVDAWLHPSDLPEEECKYQSPEAHKALRRVGNKLPLIM